MKADIDWSNKPSPWDKYGPEMAEKIRLDAGIDVRGSCICRFCSQIFKNRSGLVEHERWCSWGQRHAWKYGAGC